MQDEKRPPVAKTNQGAPKPGVKPAKKSAAAKAKKKVSPAVIAAVLIVVVIVGLLAAVYFDIGGAKQAAVSVLNLDTTATDSGDDTAQANDDDAAAQASAQADIDAQKAKLEQRQKDAADKESALDQREQELNDKEQDLATREAAVSEAQTQADSTAAREQYLASAAKIFEQMDTAKAATAISGMSSVEDMAQILMHMSEDQAALIMDKLSSKLATTILSEMMK